MSIRLSAVLTFMAFLVVFGLLIGAGRWGDLLVEALFWAALGLACLYLVVRLLRGQPPTTDQTAGLPAAIRRWVLGESGRR